MKRNRQASAILIASWTAMLAGQVVCAHPGPGLVVASDGTIYLTIGPTHQVWRVDEEGEASVVVTGGMDQEFRVPHHLVLDDEERLYTASDSGSFVWRITNDGALTKIFPPDEWDDRATVGVGGDPFTIAPDGAIIAVTTSGRRGENRIHRITVEGKVELLAGGPDGFADGRGSEARFGNLHNACFAWGSDGDLYLTDFGRRVRRIAPDGSVSTVAGGEERGMRDGPAADARFDFATGLVVAPDGSIYVADSGARRIRKISTEGVVSTIAGTGKRGGQDGAGTEATFDDPVGVALDDKGILCVLEYAREDGEPVIKIRRIDTDLNVTTHTRIVNPESQS